MNVRLNAPASPADTSRLDRCGVCGRAAAPGRWLCESCATPSVDIPAERKHFHMLNLADRERAIRAMVEAGSSDYGAAAATGLSVEAVREIIQAGGKHA